MAESYGPREGLRGSIGRGEAFSFAGGLGVLSVTWRGGELVRKAPAACARAIDRVMVLCVGNAVALVRVDTGHLKGTIGIEQPAGLVGILITGIWGATAAYAIYQEIGPVWTLHPWGFTPFLRPSADRYYPELPGFVLEEMAVA